MTSLTSLSIDIGECQQASVQALMQARAEQRRADPEGSRNSFLARASALFGRSGNESIVSLVDRQTSLTSLKRTGLLPEDIVQGGGTQMTFKRLTNAYSVQSLVRDFNFKWHHFVQLGLETDDLRHMTIEDFRCMRVTAEHLMRDMPLTASDLVRLKMPPYLLRELGFTFEHLLNLRVSRSQIDQIMTKEEMTTYFHPSPQQLTRLGGASTHSTHTSVSQRSLRHVDVEPGQLTF